MHWIKRLFLGMVAAGFCCSAAAESFFPFYDRVQTEEGSFFAVRPFYSHTVLEEGDLKDVLWPLYSRKDFKDEKTSRALIFYFTHRFDSDQQTPRKRRWLFPFYFQGRDVNSQNYFAVFPFGGTVREFLGRDSIEFFLFPLYGKSQINDVKTTSVLWPIYSRTRGDGIERDRLFPLIGKSTLKGKYTKRFLFWPLWNSADYFYPRDSGTSWILFPLCGRAEMDQEQTWWLLPPFFRYTQGTRQNRLNCPWPFFQKLDSEQREKLFVWPLWGSDRYNDGAIRKHFMFWPFLWSLHSEDDHLIKTSRTALPFFFYEREMLREDGISDTKPVEVSSCWTIWPLMSWQREATVTRFRLLELWPVKNAAPVERNWAPLWTLYKRTDQDGLIAKDILWFAWHSEQSPSDERKEWSLLKGLLSYKKENDARSFRVIWLPLGK